MEITSLWRCSRKILEGEDPQTRAFWDLGGLSFNRASYDAPAAGPHGMTVAAVQPCRLSCVGQEFRVDM
eukprot:7248605-Pyramimonas_sp.AAC.1